MNTTAWLIERKGSDSNAEWFMGYGNSFTKVAANASQWMTKSLADSVLEQLRCRESRFGMFHDSYTAEHMWMDRDPAEPSANTVEGATPFGNCKFQICDLPGQCRSEGKCHHPVTEGAAAQSQGLSYVAVGSVSPQVFRASDEPWCREILLYSPDNKGDSPERRVMLYTHPLADRPEGWKMVPVELTQEMVNAAHQRLWSKDLQERAFNPYAEAYQAMIAAAPTPPAAPKNAEDRT